MVDPDHPSTTKKMSNKILLSYCVLSGFPLFKTKKQLFDLVYFLPANHVLRAVYPPVKWQWKIPIFNREYIFNRSIFHCHVSLPKGKLNGKMKSCFSNCRHGPHNPTNLCQPNPPKNNNNRIPTQVSPKKLPSCFDKEMLIRYD